jgi:hypothetical protein
MVGNPSIIPSCGRVARHLGAIRKLSQEKLAAISRSLPVERVDLLRAGVV